MSLSHVRLFVTPWTIAYRAPRSMEFSRQEYWSGLPFPSPGDLPNPGIEPGSPALQADALPSEPAGKLIASNICFISDFIFFIFWQLIFNYFPFTSNCSLLMISCFFFLRLQGKCFVQFSYVSFNETFFHEHFLRFGLQGNITFPLRHDFTGTFYLS